MRNYLLAGTSALALALGAGAANAQSAPGKFDIKISGDAYFEGGLVGQDWNTTAASPAAQAAGAAGMSTMRTGDFTNRFRLTINPEAQADNGIKYGAVVRIRANAGNSATAALVDGDRAYIYVSSNFGTLQGGVVAGPSDLTYVGHPADWQMLGLYDQWRSYTGHSANYAWGQWQGGGSATQGMQLLESHLVDTKLVYYTPRFFGQSATTGLQGAVSYTPQVGSSGALGFGSAGGANNNVNTGVNRCGTAGSGIAPNLGCGAGAFQDVYELTANYTENFGPWMVKASAGYSGGTAPDAVDILGTKQMSSYHDLETAQVGLQVGYQNFVVGGGYVWGGQSGYLTGIGSIYPAKDGTWTSVSRKDQSAWNIGGQYTWGPLVLGVKYTEETDYLGTGYANGSGVLNVASPNNWIGAYERTLSAVTAGAMYTVAPGLRTGLEYTHFENKDSTPQTGTFNAVTGGAFAGNTTPNNDSGDVFLVRGVVNF